MNKVRPEDLSKTWDEMAEIWENLPSRSPNRIIEHFHGRVENFIVEMFSDDIGPDSKNVLDLGCGDGKLLRHMKNSYFSVLSDLFSKALKKEELIYLAYDTTFFGVDISREMLKRAEERTKGSAVFYVTDKLPEFKRKMKERPQFRFVEYDLRNGTPFKKEGNFDYVMITGNTIGNIESPSVLLKYTYKILKSLGCLIIGSYNPKFMTEQFVNSYYRRLPSQIELLSFNPQEHTVYFDLEGLFSKWYSKEELSELLRGAGFDNYRIKQEGIGFLTVATK